MKKINKQDLFEPSTKKCVTHSFTHVLSHWSFLALKTNDMNVGSKLSNINLHSHSKVDGNSFVQLLDSRSDDVGLNVTEISSRWTCEKLKLLLQDFTGSGRQNRATNSPCWETRNSNKDVDSHIQESEQDILIYVGHYRIKQIKSHAPISAIASIHTPAGCWFLFCLLVEIVAFFQSNCCIGWRSFGKQKSMV